MEFQGLKILVSESLQASAICHSASRLIYGKNSPRFDTFCSGICQEVA